MRTSPLFAFTPAAEANDIQALFAAITIGLAMSPL